MRVLLIRSLKKGKFFCTVKVHLISKSEGRRPNLTLGTVSICQFSTLQLTLVQLVIQAINYFTP